MRTIMETLLVRMEQYANNLETIVEERTEDYLIEKNKTEDLLYRLLPKYICSRLVSSKAVVAETFSSASIYFSDIVGFTALSAESSPLEVKKISSSLHLSTLKSSKICYSCSSNKRIRQMSSTCFEVSFFYVDCGFSQRSLYLLRLHYRQL